LKSRQPAALPRANGIARHGEAVPAIKLISIPLPIAPYFLPGLPSGNVSSITLTVFVPCNIQAEAAKLLLV